MLNKIYELRREWQLTYHKLELELKHLDEEDVKQRARKNLVLAKIIKAKKELDAIAYQIQSMEMEKKVTKHKFRHTGRVAEVTD